MDDYERLAAREWQEIGDTHTLVRPRLPSKAVGIGYFEPDTQARIAWRNREPPTDFVTLPRDFIRDERNVQGRAKERPDGQDIRVPELERIAHETSTEVVQQLEKGRRGGTNVVVTIWGSQEAAAEAKSRIHQWVRTYVPEPLGAKRNWAKVYSVGTPEQHARYESKVRKEEELDQYRRDPPIDAVFTAMGKFEWDPQYDSPEEVLGAHLEACDPLRTEYACYIRSIPHQKALKVMGNDQETVKKALNRLRGAFFQAIARSRANSLLPVYLLNPVDRDALSSKIVFRPVYPIGVDSKDVDDQHKALGVQTCLESESVGDDEVTRRVHRADRLVDENARRFRKAATKALATAKYFRGNLQMSAIFGVFLLKRYRNDINDIESFEAMMEEDQVEGSVSPGCAAFNHQLLSALQTSTMIHDPKNPEDIHALPRPKYSAAFLMRHKHTKPDLRLDVEFELDRNSNDADCLMRKWSRYIHDHEQSVKLLDACLIDLQSDSDAWLINISAMESVAVDKVVELQNFAENVGLNAACARSGNQDDRFIEFKATPGVILHKMVQRKHWIFEFNHTGYLVDVAEAREFHLRHPGSKTPNQYDLLVQSPSWRVSIYRRAWDIHLAESVHLGIGEGMTGDLSTANFFPPLSDRKTRSDIPGFLEVLDKVRKIIRGSDGGDVL